MEEERHLELSRRLRQSPSPVRRGLCLLRQWRALYGRGVIMPWVSATKKGTKVMPTTPPSAKALSCSSCRLRGWLHRARQQLSADNWMLATFRVPKAAFVDVRYVDYIPNSFILSTNWGKICQPASVFHLIHRLQRAVLRDARCARQSAAWAARRGQKRRCFLPLGQLCVRLALWPEAASA